MIRVSDVCVEQLLLALLRLLQKVRCPKDGHLQDEVEVMSMSSSYERSKSSCVCMPSVRFRV